MAKAETTRGILPRVGVTPASSRSHCQTKGAELSRRHEGKSFTVDMRLNWEPVKGLLTSTVKRCQREGEKGRSRKSSFLVAA